MSSHIQQYTEQDGAKSDIGREVWIGIDPSLTAFAVCAIDDKTHYVAQVLTPEPRGVQRLWVIQTFLGNFLRNFETIHDVALEGTVVNSASASVLGELSGAVKLELRSHGIYPLQVPPMSLKKFVLGASVRQQKSHMMMATLKRYFVEIPDDNAVDAYGLSRIARGMPISKIEEQVLAKLADPKFRD